MESVQPRQPSNTTQTIADTVADLKYKQQNLRRRATVCPVFEPLLIFV